MVTLTEHGGVLNTNASYVRDPVAAPARFPISAPVALPSAAPVSAPVGVPSAAPVSAPVSAPVRGPVGAPVASPMSPPVAPPLCAPDTVSTPTRRMCYSIKYDSPRWKCMNETFCASGLLGENPVQANTNFVVMCKQSSSGYTQNIMICQDYKIGEQIIPPHTEFPTIAKEELHRICGY